MTSPVMNNALTGLSRELDTPKKNLRTKPSPIALWQPEIVLPERRIAQRAIVTVGEPALRPEAMQAQLDGTRTMLAALAERREALTAAATDAATRVREAASDQARVSAMFETYRVESALDDVLTGTMKQLASLMKDRGLR
jgi:hypothetical protein